MNDSERDRTEAAIAVVLVALVVAIAGIYLVLRSVLDNLLRIFAL